MEANELENLAITPMAILKSSEDILPDLKSCSAEETLFLDIPLIRLSCSLLEVGLWRSLHFVPLLPGRASF